MLPTKDPKEIVAVIFDYTPLVVSDVEVGIRVLSGNDPNPSAMLEGTFALDATGMKVVQLVKDGLSGVTYVLWCASSKLNGERIVAKDVMQVSNR